MYKYLIIGIAVVFALSGNYYIRKAGGAELISKAISGETKTNSIPIPIEDLVGLYVCDKLSGCNNKYILLLKNDKTSELLQISNDVEIGSEEISEIIAESAQNLTLNQDNEILSNSTSTENINIDPVNVEQISTTTSIDSNSSEIINIEKEDLPDTESNSEISSQLLSTLELDKKISYIIEKGVWDLDIQNILVVTIKERGTSTYQIPQKIVIKNIDDLRNFSNIFYTKNVYEDMVNPTFIRQD